MKQEKQWTITERGPRGYIRKTTLSAYDRAAARCWYGPVPANHTVTVSPKKQPSLDTFSAFLYRKLFGSDGPNSTPKHP
jgi:hypothetical protein